MKERIKKKQQQHYIHKTLKGEAANILLGEWKQTRHTTVIKLSHVNNRPTLYFVLAIAAAVGPEVNSTTLGADAVVVNVIERVVWTRVTKGGDIVRVRIKIRWAQR